MYRGHNPTALPLGSFSWVENAYQQTPGKYVVRPGVTSSYGALAGPGAEATVGYVSSHLVLLSAAQGAGSDVQALYDITNATDVENEAFGHLFTGSEPGEGGTRARPTLVSVETRGYANTASKSAGVRHIYVDGSTTVATRAGMPRGVVPLMTVDATGAQAYNTPANHVAAYRVVFSREYDKHTVVGAPSGRAVTYVTYTGARIWTLRVPLHPDLVAGDVLEVYRTPYNDNGTSADGALIERDPGISFRLALRYTLTSSDITAGYVDWDDNIPNEQLGELLYTDASVETDQQENLVPPGSVAMCAYKGMLVQGNLVDRSFVDLEFVNAVDLDSDGTFDGATPRTANLTYTSGNATVTVNSGIATLAVGQLLTNSTVGTPTDTHPHFPAGTRITAVDSGSGEITVSNAPTSSATGNVVFLETLVVVDNTYTLGTAPVFALNYASLLPSVANAPYSVDGTSGTYVFAQDFASLYQLARSQEAVHTGNPTTTVGAGKVTIEVDADTLDEVTVISSRPGVWRSGVEDWEGNGSTAVPFYSGRSRGAVTWTKPNQHEHRPSGAAYTQQVTSSEILQMVATDDYVYIATGTELIVGVGTFDGFTFRTLSSSRSGGWAPSGPRCMTVLNNAVYVLTTQGFFRIQGTSVARIDNDLATELYQAVDPAVTSDGSSGTVLVALAALEPGYHYAYHVATESWSVFTFESPEDNNKQVMVSPGLLYDVTDQVVRHVVLAIETPLDVYTESGTATITKISDTVFEASVTMAVGDVVFLPTQFYWVASVAPADADGGPYYTLHKANTASYGGSRSVYWGIPVTFDTTPYATEDGESWKQWSAVTLRPNMDRGTSLPLIVDEAAFYKHGIEVVDIDDPVPALYPAIRFIVPADVARYEELALHVRVFGFPAGMEGLTLEYVAGDGPRRIR